MSIVEHIILFSFLILFFTFWGKYNYNVKNNYKFWFYAMIPILLFSLITGMRYGWGNDYMWYKYQFEHALSNDFVLQETPFVWRFLNQLMNKIGLNYVGAFVVYSIVPVTCAFVLVRSYGKESKYMYAFIIPAILFSITFTIRQGFSTSFLFLALYFFNVKKWAGVLISVLFAGVFHVGTLVVVMIMIVFKLFTNKRPINWKIAVPLLLFFTYFFDVSTVSGISNLLSNFSLRDSNYSNYLENSDRWFSVEAINIEAFERGLFANTIWSLFYISFIYLGYKALKIKPNFEIIYLYNSVVFGIIFYQATRWFEIWRRFAEPLISFYFIVLGYSLFVLSRRYVSYKDTTKLKRLKFYAINPVVYKIMVGIILLCLVLYWGRFLFYNPKADFFWNK
jgi:hypothetical protein